MLQQKDNWGYQRENSILTILVTIIMLRYIKYFSNWNKFISETLFYSKFSISILLFLISRKVAIWYLLACLVIWLLIKYPKYNGPSNIIFIPTEEIFMEILNKSSSGHDVKHKKNNKDNYLLMIFYSNYSYDCLYTEELFAQLSIKYYSDNLRFGKMNVDWNENFVRKLGINLSPSNVVLPYLIMYKNGEEYKRYPGLDHSGKTIKIHSYKEKDIVDIFQIKSIVSNK